jgi:hypothetical protein
MPLFWLGQDRIAIETLSVLGTRLGNLEAVETLINASKVTYETVADKISQTK